MIFRSLSFVLLIGLCACQRPCLWVQSEAVRPASLASHIVDTPDPRRECPDVGQRLLAYWRLPAATPLEDGYFLVLAMRFGSREERCVCIPLHQTRGCYIYNLLNDEYFERCGFTAFKAEIVCDDALIAEWRHQAWCDLIEIAIHDEPSWQGRPPQQQGLEDFEGLGD